MDNNIEVGFGKASIWGAWKTKKKLADEMNVRAVAIKGNGCTSIIAVFDLDLIWPSTCTKLSETVGKVLKISASNIGIFTTQNHDVDYGSGDDLNVSKLSKALIKTAKQAVNKLKPVKMAMINVHPEPALNFCRRVRFGEFGAFTFWYGFKKRGEGKADASHLVKMAIKSLAQGEPYQYRCLNVHSTKDYKVKDCPVYVPTPLYLKRANDDLLQGIFFKDLKGKPVGSIVRFAAHPATSNRPDYNAGDYPLYVCRRMEKIFGGASVFMTGPCGDQTPLIEKKSLKLAKELGTKIADAALKALKKAKWDLKGPVSVVAEKVKLRIRNDFPRSRKKAEKELYEIKDKIKKAAESGMSLVKIKKMTERYETLLYTIRGHNYKLCGLDLFKLFGKTIVHPIFALRIGKYAIVGLPGEPYGRYSVRLRKETIGNSLLVSEEGNGYLSYLPTTSEFKYGSFGPNAAACAPDCEAALINGAKRALRRLGFK